MRVLTVILSLISFPLSSFAGEDSSSALHENVDHSIVHNLDHESTEQGMLSELAGEFGVTWRTLIPQMINFILVALALYYFAIRPVAKTLDERQQKIADGLQYAEEMKVQLAEAERERAAKIKQAAEDAQRILTEAREQSKEMIEKKIQEAAAQAEAIIRKASEATELERQKMLSDVRKEVARLVVATSSKVLSRDLSDQEKQSFSESASKELAGSV